MTGFNGMDHCKQFDGDDNLCILDLWRMGMDTLDIARAMRCPESQIANRLPDILAASRQDAEWDRTA